MTLDRKVILRLWRIYHKYNEWIWEVGWSGGKDSTLLLDFLLSFYLKVRGRGKKIPKTYIIHVDTLLEHPRLQRAKDNVIKDIQQFIIENELDNDVKFVYLTPTHDFFWKILVDGYPIPHFRFRWCVNWLKEKPMRKFLKETVGESPLVELSGIRRDESPTREKYFTQRGGSMMQITSKNRVAFAPLFDWTTKDVFRYLETHKPVWGGSFKWIKEIYKREDMRYGCVLCTVVKREKALDPNDYVDKKFLDLKSLLIKISSDSKNREKKKDGRLGRLKVEARLELAKIIEKEYLDVFPENTQKRIVQAIEELKKLASH